MLLFDIDGTLLLTGGAGRVALERAFEELFGIPDVWQNLIPDGKTDSVILNELATNALGRSLKKKEFIHLRDRYLRLFRAEIKKSPRFRLMPGIRELLTALSKKTNNLLGLATGNFEDAAWLKVKQGGLKHFFKFGGFGSDSDHRLGLTHKAVQRGERLRGEEIHRHNVFVIGDTIHDIRAGKKLGIKTIAVATGSTQNHELAAHQPDLLLDDLTKKEIFLEFVT